MRFGTKLALAIQERLQNFVNLFMRSVYPPTSRPGNPNTRLGIRKTWTQSMKELLRRLGRQALFQVFRLQACVALRRVAVAAAAAGAHDQ